MADQDQDRVAAVVARTHRETISVNGSPAWGIEQVVGALDRAGLLLTEARRGRVVDVLTTARARLTSCEAALRYEAAGDHKPGSCTLRASDALHAAGRCDALLRELAGEASDPWEATRDAAYREATPPEPARLNPFENVGWGSPAHEAAKEPAPRRMAGLPGAVPPSPHAGEHDERPDCAMDPPCQPVAAASHICAHGIERAWSVEDCTSCRGREHSPEAMAAKPAHEHRWAAVAWESSGGAYSRAKRVTREHCVVGDCRATREVGHGG